MKTFISGSLGQIAALILVPLLTSSSASAADPTPTLVLDHHSYLPGEAIVATFANGPGNAKDWVGIYPEGVTPGGASTIWNYVDGTQQGQVGLKEGSVTFPTGLDTVGDWRAFLLLNDGYSPLAEIGFRVADPTLPFVRPEKPVYEPKEPITINFSNGPGNSTDWIGLYRPGVTPSGNPPSIDWRYVGGTQTATDGLTEGSVTITAGLSVTGDYVVFFLERDGYTVLASEPFKVAEPPATIPRIVSVTPADGSTDRPANQPLTVLIQEGTFKVNEQTITLKVDGVSVKAGVARIDTQLRITYQPDHLFPSLSSHQYEVTYLDTANPPNPGSATTSFTVGEWKNVVLPTPLYFEDFEKTDEGTLPKGWTAESYSEVPNPEFDLGDLGSATYANWVVVDSARFNNALVLYSNPANTSTDYRRVLTVNPMNVVNGKVVELPMLQGHALFGDSGYRNGRSQVLYVYTPDYNLTGRQDVYLAFYSAWEQNQDSIGAVEYSIDEGQNWHPLRYYLDGPDIVTVTDENTGETTIDVDATFNTPRSDIATYLDGNGDTQGGTYGAFIRSPITQDLAPFISSERDDNPVSGKRVERLRVVLADNQPKVRFRFAESGTDSWYWGIDNLGIYSIPGEQPTLSIRTIGSQIQLRWDVAFADYQLESSSSIAPADWKPVAGVTGVSATLPATEAQTYFRLHRP